MKKSNNGSDYEDSIKHLQNIMKAVKKTPATTESISIKDESVEYSSESSDNDGSKKENPKKKNLYPKAFPLNQIVQNQLRILKSPILQKTRNLHLEIFSKRLIKF